MIQFNLLPDVKIDYIKSQRSKRTVFLIAGAVGSASLALFVALFVLTNFIQTKHLNDLSHDIKQDSAKLQSTQDISKILTIQNQLASLPALDAQKPVASRLFGYLAQVIPNKASLAKLNVDFGAHTMTFTGSADSLETVNKFVDTLKFTQYQKKGDDNKVSAFSQVVLTTFGRDDKGASYTINLQFDPAIFDVTNDVVLIVPNQVTTRSETEKPDALFQPLHDSSNPSSSTGTTPSSTTTTQTGGH